MFIFVLYLTSVFLDNSGLENIFGEEVFSYKKFSPQKWKNAKVNRKEEEENEQMLKKIMECPGKRALNKLVADIAEFNKEEMDEKLKGNDQFNTVCWVWGLRNCHKDEPESPMDNDDPKNIFETEKHLKFLNRKYMI